MKQKLATLKVPVYSNMDSEDSAYISLIFNLTQLQKSGFKLILHGLVDFLDGQFLYPDYQIRGGDHVKVSYEKTMIHSLSTEEIQCVKVGYSTCTHTHIMPTSSWVNMDADYPS